MMRGSIGSTSTAGPSTASTPRPASTSSGPRPVVRVRLLRALDDLQQAHQLDQRERLIVGSAFFDHGGGDVAALETDDEIELFQGDVCQRTGSVRGHIEPHAHTRLHDLGQGRSGSQVEKAGGGHLHGQRGCVCPYEALGDGAATAVARTQEQDSEHAGQYPSSDG